MDDSYRPEPDITTITFESKDATPTRRIRNESDFTDYFNSCSRARQNLLIAARNALLRTLDAERTRGEMYAYIWKHPEVAREKLVFSIGDLHYLFGIAFSIHDILIRKSDEELSLLARTGNIKLEDFAERVEVPQLTVVNQNFLYNEINIFNESISKLHFRNN